MIRSVKNNDDDNNNHNHNNNNNNNNNNNTFDAPGWLDRDPYGIHTSSLSYNNNNNNNNNNKPIIGLDRSSFVFATAKVPSNPKSALHTLQNKYLLTGTNWFSMD